MFKKTKQPTVEELVNTRLNKEKLARAGFGYHVEMGLYEMVLNKTLLIPENMLKLDWAKLKEEILKNSRVGYEIEEAVKQRLEL